jgi:parallel beta-helix repeat protein
MATVICLVCFNCSQKSGTSDSTISVDPSNFEKHLQELLITADSGAVIELPEGQFDITRSLSLDGIKGITIKGQGKDKTVLSFKNQIQGAEGLLVKANDVTLEGFTIEDSKGDGLKLLDSYGVVLRDLNITWTNGADSTNGGYGIYPVACQKVLIEHCEASYASDAGIYVGQSTDVIIRDNLAHHNVAGIEIENSRNVDCYNNLAENNTGGILIFNLPDLPQAFGYNVRVHANTCRDNNFQNFSPKGGMVNTLPPGAGMLVVAHKDLEIFDNEITGHKTLGLGIISYLFTRRPFDVKNGFEPFYYNVNVHDNVFERSDDIADQSTEFGQMISVLFGGQPQDILIDGIFHPDTNTGQPVCFENNGEGLRFANLNAAQAEGVEGMLKTMDQNLTVFECSLPALFVEAL